MKLQTGDIFALRGDGFFGRLCQKLLLPYTDRFHFGLLGDYIPEEDDWVILESIDKGVAVGRLSFYKGRDIKFYRPIVPDVGVKAARQATRQGRAKYDYGVYLPILMHGVKALVENVWKHRTFKLWYTDIPNMSNSKLLCTELIDEAYKGLAIVLDKNFEATPSNFQRQVELGYVRELKENEDGQDRKRANPRNTSGSLWCQRHR